MTRCAALVGAISIASAAGLLFFSARAADNPTAQRLSQLQDRAQVTLPAAGMLSPGYLVVTGFSGVRLAPQVAPGIDPLDKTFIDLDGPSIRVLDLSTPGAPAQGQVVPAPIPGTVTARQVGQVFAVALDDATPPNIYVAATSAYGLPIVAATPDRDGTLSRLRRGAAGAQFMPGLFGPQAVNGGPGSIWKIDGRSGAVSLFVNIQNTGAGLGDIAFDATHRQFFVSDRASGFIHRVGLDGFVRGTYDHGTTGRSIVGLQPVPDQPGRRLNIQSSVFDPGNPQTWGLPAPARRTFGLAIFRNRLFYAIAEGPQVWSVALTPDGSFGTSASWELSLPPSPRPAEVASILFDDEGRIYLAERGASTGAYDFKVLAAAGEARVLRYRLREPGDPPGPRRWAPVPDEYSVGYRSSYRNTNGGIAFGDRYTQNNTFGGCGGTLWTTGEQLRAASDPAIAQQLATSGPLALNGVQGVAVDLLRPRNAPPRASLFARYNDLVAETVAREQFGHMGDLAIWQSCGTPPPRLVLTCPTGFYWNGFAQQCELPVAAAACPSGQRWDGGACVSIMCWGGQRFDGRQCVCPSNMVWNGQRCVPGRVCPTGQILDGDRCVPGRVCPIGQVADGERCVPTPSCPNGQVWDGQTRACVCPAGQDSNGTACQCPPGQYFNGSLCQISNGDSPNPPPDNQPGTCPRGQIQRGDFCLVVDPVRDPPADQCASDRIFDYVSKRCVCRTFYEVNGVCQPAPPRGGVTPPADFCQGGPFKLVGGTCCLGNDTCTAKAAVCPAGTQYELGPPWSSSPVCCRTVSAGACAPPSETKEHRCARLYAGDAPALARCLQGSDSQCQPVTESRSDRCWRLFGPKHGPLDPIAAEKLAVCNAGGAWNICFANNDCVGSACCGRDGFCYAAGSQAASVPPSTPQTCPGGQTQQGGGCAPACTGGRVWNGESCSCPTGTWNGTSCGTLSEATSVRPNCRKGTTWNGEACVAIRARPKCKRGTRWDGERCRPVSQAESPSQAVPQLTPDFGIGIGIGGGGGGPGSRGPRGPGRVSPPRGGGGTAN